MVALTKSRNTPRAEGDIRQGTIGAGAKLFGGAIVMRNAAGHLVQGQAGGALVAVGRSERMVDNTGGADGALSVDYRMGIFKFENSNGADEVTFADIGGLCYVVDDQTVSLTDQGGTLGRAGVIDFIENGLVWVRLDEGLTNAS